MTFVREFARGSWHGLRAVGAVVLWLVAFCFAVCTGLLAYLGQRAWPWHPTVGSFSLAEVLGLLADGAKRKADKNAADSDSRLRAVEALLRERTAQRDDWKAEAARLSQAQDPMASRLN